MSCVCPSCLLRKRKMPSTICATQRVQFGWVQSIRSGMDSGIILAAEEEESASADWEDSVWYRRDQPDRHLWHYFA